MAAKARKVIPDGLLGDRFVAVSDFSGQFGKNALHYRCNSRDMLQSGDEWVSLFSCFLGLGLLLLWDNGFRGLHPLCIFLLRLTRESSQDISRESRTESLWMSDENSYVAG